MFLSSVVVFDNSFVSFLSITGFNKQLNINPICKGIMTNTSTLNEEILFCYEKCETGVFLFKETSSVL